SEVACGGRRQAKAKKIARDSRNSPARVGPMAVMEGRFWLCGARKINGYTQASQDTMRTIQPKMIMSASGFDNDFAELFLILEVAMCRGDFRQREDAIHNRFQLLTEYEFQHLVQLSHRPHERAEEAPLLAEKEAQIDPRIE